MGVHRFVALLSAAAIVGLFGAATRAEASNFSRPMKRTNEIASLRAKIRQAPIEGCSGQL